MKLSDRVRALESAAHPQPIFKLLYVADDADKAAEVARFRGRTGYKGAVVCIDEADARL